MGLPEDTIEEGTVYFLYKPKVQVDTVTSLNDVQRFFILLDPKSRSASAAAAVAAAAGAGAGTSPSRSNDAAGTEHGGAAAGAGCAGGEGKAGREGGSGGGGAMKNRLIVVPKKRLPNTAHPGRERFYGFVEAVADDSKALTSGLASKTYQTKTRGMREQGPARVVGEGTYVIARHGRGTNLAYKLLVPVEGPKDAQAVFCIQEVGSYVFSIKNPSNVRPGAPSARPEPEYTEPQAKRLKSASWIGVEDPSMLEVEGTEVLLVAARADLVGELGASGQELEKAAASESEGLTGIDDAQVPKEGSEQQQLKQQVAEKLAEQINGDNKDKVEGSPVHIEPAVEGTLV